ncbi:hypothetical protein LCGC14_1112120 [marine sediment metagenome]|uniref:Uncharacterized protein n=1 Tax=marine sediment metagenome TaxID=412755 RepID=A0A0F9MUC6_9ZZZZ
MKDHIVALWVCLITAFALLLFTIIMQGEGWGRWASSEDVNMAVDYVATQIAQKTVTPMPSEKWLR